MLTPYQTEKNDEDFTFDNVKRRRKTKDEQRRSKEQQKEEIKFSKQMLVPKTKMCEDGATVAATPTFSLAKQCGLVS